MLDRFIVSFVKSLSDERVAQLAENYVAGHSLEEGVDYMRKMLSERGIMTTGDILGEVARSPEEADRYFRGYVNLIESVRIDARKYIQKEGGISFYSSPRKPFSISLKPSAICHVISEDLLKFNDRTPFFERLEKLVSIAEEAGIPLTLDMEDHNYTDLSLDVAQRVWANGHDNFGIVLQTRMNRTQNDVEKLFGKRSELLDPIFKRVRVCLGIYQEPSNIAVGKKEAKAKYLGVVKRLIDCGVYVEIATHDTNLIEDCLEYLDVKKVPREQVEFQMLKGPKRVEARNIPLVKKSDKVIRIYSAFELKRGDGVPYQRRRLMNSPEMVWAALNDEIFGWL